MAIAVDQATIGHIESAAGSTTIVLTTTAAVAAGARIVLGIGWWSSSQTISTITDTAGNSYAVNHTSSGGSAQQAIASAHAPAGLASGSTITVTFTGSVSERSLNGSSFTGIDTTSPVGNVSFTRPTATTAWSTGNIVTTVAGELIYGAAHNDSNATTSTPTSPAIETHDFNIPSITFTNAYRIEATPGTYTVAGTWATSSSESVITGVAYKPAAGGPPAQPQVLRPDADVVATGWTPAPLWSKIEESVADGTFITSQAS